MGIQSNFNTGTQSYPKNCWLSLNILQILQRVLRYKITVSINIKNDDGLAEAHVLIASLQDSLNNMYEFPKL